MKIILSPSKTKTLTGRGSVPLFNEALTAKIVSHMESLDKERLGKALKIKGDLLDTVYEQFQNYKSAPTGEAASSYTGLAFKNLDWPILSDEAKAFGRDHLYIMSALYGLVNPLQNIKEYRLDLVDKIFDTRGESLYQWWEESVNEALSGEDWILNLASKEYSSLVKHPNMVTVEFLEEKKGILKQFSTSSKQMRGQMAHYVLENQLTKVEDLPDVLGDFHRQEGTEPLSETKLIQYIRQ